MNETPEWQVVIETLPAMRDLVRQDPASHGMGTLLELSWGYVVELAASWDRGLPFVWHNLGFSPELILALGGTGHLCIQTQAVLQNIAGDPANTQTFIDLAEA